MADHFASSVVKTRKTRRHLVIFHDYWNWVRFKPGRNAKWNTKFPEFPKFQKKGQPREVNRNFRNKFPEICVPFEFEPEFPFEWKAPRVSLHRDLLILEKALNGKVPEFDTSEDWQLLVIC